MHSYVTNYYFLAYNIHVLYYLNVDNVTFIKDTFFKLHFIKYLIKMPSPN